MEVIKQFLKENNIFPKVDFDDKAPHILTILNAKKEDFVDKKGQETQGIKLLVKEDEEFKTVLTTSSALLLKLRECKEGETYQIQMKFIKVGASPIRTYEVEKVGEENAQPIEIKKEDIPIIEEEDIGDPPF